MKTIKNKIKTILKAGIAMMIACFFTTQKTQAQNVGIGASSFTPDAQSMLEVQSTSKGVLIPRMTDVQRAAISPTTNSDYGLLVYQTNTVSTTNAAGFWYWNGTAWMSLSSGINWSTLGNAGTSASTNFIGTTDGVDFVMRTNNTERARIKSSGYFGIGTTAPTVKLQVDGGSSSSLSSGGYFMTGDASTYNLVMDRDDIMARNNGSASALDINYYGGNVIINGSNSSGKVGIGTSTPSAMFELANASTSSGARIHTALTSNSAAALRVDHDGTGYGIYSEAAGNATTGIYSSQGGVTPSIFSVVSTAGWSTSIGSSQGRGLWAGGTDIGVEGVSQDDGNINTDQLAGTFYVKGASGGIPSFACVGSVVDNVAYKIVGTGIVSTVVDDAEGKPVVMAAPEAPEALFQDFGTGQLVNGQVHIVLDPILSKNITVDEKHPLKIFIQLNDECNGVYVKNKDGNGFDVVELNKGLSNAKFSWMLTATRKNETRGGITSDYENFRFNRTNHPGFNMTKTNSQCADVK